MQSKLTSTFAALGDATRLAIVERLLDQGELPAGDLLDIGALSAPAISRHLKVLREAGVVTRRVDKQRRLYSVRTDAVSAISTWTEQHRQYWDPSLDRLERELLRHQQGKNR